MCSKVCRKVFRCRRDAIEDAGIEMVCKRLELGVCRSGGIMLMHDDEGGEPEPQRGSAATTTLQQLSAVAN